MRLMCDHERMTACVMASPPVTSVFNVGTSAGLMNLTNVGVNSAQFARSCVMASSTALSRSSSLGMQTHPPKIMQVRISVMLTSKVDAANWNDRVLESIIIAGP